MSDLMIVGNDETDDNNSRLLARIEEIASFATKERRDQALADFIEDNRAALNGISHRVRAELRVPHANQDECAQFALLELWKIVEDAHEKPTSLNTIRHLWGVLKYRTYQRTKGFLESSEAGGSAMSGVSTVIRRQTEMRKTRELLAKSLGREPSVAEIVESTNERMERTRKDAKRQRMLCTEEDWTFDPHLTSIDDRLDHDSAFAAADPGDSDLASYERFRLIAMICKFAEARSDEHFLVARTYFQPALGDSYDDNPNNAEIARRTGLNPKKVKRLLDEVKQIAQETCINYFGVDRTAGAQDKLA